MSLRIGQEGCDRRVANVTVKFFSVVMKNALRRVDQVQEGQDL
jgi:hypothetical protein